MASDSPSPPFLSWQFLVLIAAGLGIIMAQPGTLPLAPGSSTPADKAKAGGNVPTLTDSRLWSDPYAEPVKAEPTAAKTAEPAIVKVPPETANQAEERRVGKECRSRWSPY